MNRSNIATIVAICALLAATTYISTARAYSAGSKAVHRNNLSVKVGHKYKTRVNHHKIASDESNETLPGKIPFTTAATFKSEVLDSQVPVLVDFSATWCAPCRTMAPAVDRLADKFAGKMKFYKIDIDDDEDLADDLNVEAVPTFMVFEHGKIVKSETGNIGEEKLDADIGQIVEPQQVQTAGGAEAIF